MIEVDMRVDDNLDVFNAETEGTNIGRNLSGRLGQIAIDKDVSSVGCNQDRTEAMCSDVVGVSENPEWLLRAIPLSARRAVGCGLPAGDTDEQDKATQETPDPGECHG
jgi:hypothetical protein